MKLYYYLILLSIIFISSCKKEEENISNFPENYGEGMYIVTSNGISYYNYNDSLSSVNNQIFNTINNNIINNPKKIKFRGSKAFILAEDYIIRADAKTFEDDGVISGFLDPVDFDFTDPADRLFVADNEASEVKVVSLDEVRNCFRY